MDLENFVIINGTGNSYAVIALFVPNVSRLCNFGSLGSNCNSWVLQVLRLCNSFPRVTIAPIGSPMYQDCAILVPRISRLRNF